MELEASTRVPGNFRLPPFIAQALDGGQWTLTTANELMVAMVADWRRESVPQDQPLQRMRALLELLENPQESFPIVHVAGTSGKTSTCYYLTALLRALGETVGTTVSPHIGSLDERVQVSGAPIHREEFLRELAHFLDVAAASRICPSFHEMMIAFAYCEFRRFGVSCAVVEVGIGGRTDPTNVNLRKDKISVITDIGLDHTELLGDTIEEIAGEKAGIIMPDSDTYMLRQCPQVMTVVKTRCDDICARLHLVALPGRGEDADGSRPESFQQRNFVLAEAVADAVAARQGLCPLTSDQRRTIATLAIPGRLETIMIKGRTVILDGAHNSQKLAALAASVGERFPGARIGLLVAIGAGAAPGQRIDLRPILELADHTVVTSFDVVQARRWTSRDSSEVADHYRNVAATRLEIDDDPVSALDRLIQSGHDPILVTGSLYLVGVIRRLVVDRDPGAAAIPR